MEHARVHDAWYGTLKKSVLEELRLGRDVLMDVDVQGADLIRSFLKSQEAHPIADYGLVDVFIAPPSIESLNERLRGRGQDREQVIIKRVNKASGELDRWREFTYLILNDVLEDSYDALRSIFIAERHRIRNVQQELFYDDLPLS